MKGNEQIELQAQRYLYERAHLSGSCVVTTFDPFDLEQAFIDGAEWQKVAEVRRKYIMSEETRHKIAEAMKRRVGTKYFKRRLQAMEE